MPPTGLQLHIGRGNVENQRIILLSWEPTRTLFDKTYDDGLQRGDSPMAKPRPHYVVYVYLESHVDHAFLLLYRNETTSLSNVVYVRDLNLTSACNLAVTSFHVSLSAKFDVVGEGNKSDPVQIGHSDADSICRGKNVSVMCCASLYYFSLSKLMLNRIYDVKKRTACKKK